MRGGVFVDAGYPFVEVAKATVSMSNPRLPPSQPAPQVRAGNYWRPDVANTIDPPNLRSRQHSMAYGATAIMAGVQSIPDM